MDMVVRGPSIDEEARRNEECRWDHQGQSILRLHLLALGLVQQNPIRHPTEERIPDEQPTCDAQVRKSDLTHGEVVDLSKDARDRDEEEELVGKDDCNEDGE